MNLYRCVRDHPDELISELTYALNSRTDFDYIRKVMKTPTEIPDVKRAAHFYQLIRYSYASGLDSYASQPHSMWNNFPSITNACARLQKVVIENKDFEKLIDQYDRPESVQSRPAVFRDGGLVRGCRVLRRLTISGSRNRPELD